MNIRKLVKEKLEPQLKDSDGRIHKERLGHRTADFSQQVQILVDDIQKSGIYKTTPGRKMPGALGYKRNDRFDFKVTIDKGYKGSLHN